MNEKQEKPLNIALVSDYFFPRIGGVETHIMTLGKKYTKLGHNVVVITHKKDKYQGKVKIEDITVYYLNIPIIAKDTAIPTIFCSYMLYKRIFEEYKIDIVHGHQSLSTMSMEAIYHAQFMGIRTVLTDHSVFESTKIEQILCNDLGKYICRRIDKVICVSQTASYNTSERLGIPQKEISVIPNGIDSSIFFPQKRTCKKRIRVLFCARLVFRKGITLLADSLPHICKDERLDVIIGGSGPMINIIEQTIDEYNLQNHVTLLGGFSFEKIPELLRSCDIFVNTSLTETFCVAILEAVACGLLAVSTNVGGIQEVFGKDVIYFCSPEPKDIAKQISLAADQLISYDPTTNYRRLVEKYDWDVIASRTLGVYEEVLKKKKKEETNHNFLVQLLDWFSSF